MAALGRLVKASTRKSTCANTYSRVRNNQCYSLDKSCGDNLSGNYQAGQDRRESGAENTLTAGRPGSLAHLNVEQRQHAARQVLWQQCRGVPLQRSSGCTGCMQSAFGTPKQRLHSAPCCACFA